MILTAEEARSATVKARTAQLEENAIAAGIMERLNAQIANAANAGTFATSFHFTEGATDKIRHAVLKTLHNTGYLVLKNGEGQFTITWQEGEGS